MDRSRQPSDDQPQRVGPDEGSDALAGPPDDRGLSLDELSQAYADLIGGGEDPYQDGGGVADDGQRVADASAAGEAGQRSERQAVEDLVLAEEDDGGEPLPGEVSPRGILEAILFVGHPEDRPLTSQLVASLMRGVGPREVDELVEELNGQYELDGSPYRVMSVADGYRLSLIPEFALLRDKFYRRVGEAKLSQSAIDVLAIVAYRQGITQAEVDRLRSKPSGGVLGQLLRRDLLRIEHGAGRQKQYYTTRRFLHLFQLSGPDDLPQGYDAERLA